MSRVRNRDRREILLHEIPVAIQPWRQQGRVLQAVYHQHGLSTSGSKTQLNSSPGESSDTVLSNEEQDAKNSNPSPTVSKRPSLADGGFRPGNWPDRQDAGALQTLQGRDET